MSIKKSQAILKCFIDIKSSVWFTLGSEDETMFCDTKDRSTTSTRFSQIVTSDRAWSSVILAGNGGSRCHSTTSKFTRECRSCVDKLSNVRSFIILQSGEGLTSLNNDNSANFSGEKKCNEEFQGVYFLTIREKTLNEISYSKSFLESKGLYLELFSARLPVKVLKTLNGRQSLYSP